MLSVTNLNSTGKCPKNVIDTITSSKLRFLLVQNAFFQRHEKHHNFCSFYINFQSRKDLSTPMPFFKVTAEGPKAFDYF